MVGAENPADECVAQANYRQENRHSTHAAGDPTSTTENTTENTTNLTPNPETASTGDVSIDELLR